MTAAPRPGTAPPALHFPPTAPPWVVQTLTAMSAKGQLSGVPPQVVAGAARTESNYGTTGTTPGSHPTLYANPEGYGGYFGLGPAQRQGAGGLNPGLGTFQAQAQVWSADFATQLHAAGGTWQKATDKVSGGTSDWRYQLATVFGGHNPGRAAPAQLTGISIGPVTLSGPGAVARGAGAVASSAAGAFVKEWGVRIGLAVFGAILIVVGIKALASQAETEADRVPGESATAAAIAEGEKKESKAGKVQEGAEVAAA